MAIVLTPKLREQLNKFNFFWITTRDESRCEMTRIFGYRLNEETSVIRVIVLKEDASKVLDCFANHTRKAAMVFSDGLTFESIQIKGEFIVATDSTAEEVSLVTGEFSDRASKVFVAFGLGEDYWKANVKNIPALTLQVHCFEVYNQTPALNTGNKIC